MGDFTGFTFGGYHSFNDLGVVRTSSGDRYEVELHPEIKDRSAEVPGLNGEYYFGSGYGPKQFNIDIAFDSLTEEQFRKLRRVFGTKKIQELIFDERPYKKYMAKIESPVELSYVCFDEPKKSIGVERKGIRRDRENDQEISTDVQITDTVIVPAGETVNFTLTHTPSGEVSIDPLEVEFEYDEGTYTFTNDGEDSLTITLTYNYTETSLEPAWEQIIPWEYEEEEKQRIYKGEGKITFICYFPFAKSVYKVLPEESEEWAISSGILSEDEYEEFDTYDNETGIINIYNGGDIETGFRLYIPAEALGALTLTYKSHFMDDAPASLIINEFTLDTNEVGVLIDTTNELIVGVSEFGHDQSNNAVYKTSGKIYNQYIDMGYFFHFQPNGRYDGATLEIEGGADGIEIFYDYLYF